MCNFDLSAFARRRTEVWEAYISRQCRFTLSPGMCNGMLIAQQTKACSHTKVASVKRPGLRSFLQIISRKCVQGWTGGGMLFKGSTKVVDYGCDRHMQGTERNPVGCMGNWFSILVHTWECVERVFPPFRRSIAGVGGPADFPWPKRGGPESRGPTGSARVEAQRHRVDRRLPTRWERLAPGGPLAGELASVFASAPTRRYSTLRFTYAIYRALRTLDQKQESGHSYTAFADSSSVIKRIRWSRQRFAIAVMEVSTRLFEKENEVTVH